MTTWDYGDSHSLQRDPTVLESIVAGSYGGKYYVDNKAPTETIQLTAEPLTGAEKDAELSKARASGAQTWTLVTGGSVTGLVTSFSAERIPGTALYRVNIALLRSDQSQFQGWEWNGSLSFQRDLTVFDAMPVGAAYGSRYVYDNKLPTETMQITGEPLALADVTAELAKARARGTEQTYVVGGVSFTGYITSLQAERLPGTGYYRVTITLMASTGA